MKSQENLIHEMKERTLRHQNENQQEIYGHLDLQTFFSFETLSRGIKNGPELKMRLSDVL